MKSDRKQELDLVAGRLEGVALTQANTSSSGVKQCATYGAYRLGLTSEEEGETCEVVSQAVAADPPVEQSDRQELLNRLRKLWDHPRRTMVLGGGAGAMLLLVLVIWMVGGDGEGVPRSASAGSVPISVATDVTADSKQRPQVVKNTSGAASPRDSKTKLSPAKVSLKPIARSALAMLRGTGRALRHLAPPIPRGSTRPPGRKLRPVKSMRPQMGLRPAVDPKPVAKPAPPKVRRRRILSVCPSGFKLGGIISTASCHLANINGTFVRVGETVKGARVVAIGNSSVEMERDGQHFLIGSESSGLQEPE